MKKEARDQLIQEIIDRCKVVKKNTFKLSDHDTTWTGVE